MLEINDNMKDEALNRIYSQMSNLWSLKLYKQVDYLLT